MVVSIVVARAVLDVSPRASGVGHNDLRPRASRPRPCILVTDVRRLRVSVGTALRLADAYLVRSSLPLPREPARATDPSDKLTLMA
jgi:hypothetical protein